MPCCHIQITVITSAVVQPAGWQQPGNSKEVRMLPASTWATAHHTLPLLQRTNNLCFNMVYKEPAVTAHLLTECCVLAVICCNKNKCTTAKTRQHPYALTYRQCRLSAAAANTGLTCRCPAPLSAGMQVQSTRLHCCQQQHYLCANNSV